MAVSATVCCGAAPAVAAPAAALGVPRSAEAVVQLSDIAAGQGGFVINGASGDEYVGSSRMSDAGDVNGDGLADLLLAAFRIAGRPGATYLVHGKTGTSAVDLSNVASGVGGFVIRGPSTPFNRVGHSVSSAGDINGDGLSDLLASDVYSGGRGYVVFGKTDTAPVDLTAIEAGEGGFVISSGTGSSVGRSIAGAGDVNGDGLADVVIGQSNAEANGRIYAGRSYVVFGKTDTASVDLDNVAAGAGGFVVNGFKKRQYMGWSVEGLGDMNGDGLADLAIGLRERGTTSCYVVFGRIDTAPVELSAIDAGNGGFSIRGDNSFQRPIAAAGDVNGDGLADLLYGSPGAYETPGRSYVVFGKTAPGPVELSAVAAGVGGFVIEGDRPQANTGFSVAGARDVNGDGLGDLMIGNATAYSSDYTSRTYVVYGKTDTTPVALAAISAGAGGFAIDGAVLGDGSNYVAGAGDVNGDGLADLMVGAPSSDLPVGDRAGRAYVVLGSTTGAFSNTAVDQLGGDGPDTLTGSSTAETLVGGRGNDRLAGEGGADVLHGGSGDDVLEVDANLAKALAGPMGERGNRRQLARVAGGSGIDTLRLSGAGITLDLSKVANQGGSTPIGASRIESIERIDLTGSGDNTLLLGGRDVRDMAGMNLINSHTQAALGWTNGTYAFPSIARRHQLVVDGNAGDVADLSKYGTRWTNAGTAFYNGVSYTVYNSDTGGPRLLRLQVIVADAVTRIAPPPPARALAAGGEAPDRQR